MSSIAKKPEQPRTADPDRNSRNGVRKRLSTIALIGADGSGKTAVAKALLETCPVPLKYLYMGTSIESSNVALPTSRLIHKWKVYQHRKALQRAGKTVPEKITLHGLEHRQETRGKIGGAVRLLRRVSEEIYRQLVSWIYQLQGNVVLYDRHFMFDACPIPGTDTSQHRFTDRVHFWFLRRLYPRPGLVIFLDAPAEVLYARKQEVPIEYLEQERRNLLEKSEYSEKFVLLNANVPFEDLVTTINGMIVDDCAKQ